MTIPQGTALAFALVFAIAAAFPPSVFSGLLIGAILGFGVGRIWP